MTNGSLDPKARLKQAESIRKVRPWEKSTGSRIPDGKVISSKNRGGNSEAYFPKYS
jgi:hypothetical protein